MKEFDLFSFQVEIDETATREWYDKVDEWCCDCEDCRHFMSLAKRRELPSTVIEILEQFGFLLIRRFKTIGSFNNTSSKFRLLLTWQLVKIERIQEVSKMNVKGTKKKNQVVKVNIFEQQEMIAKAEAIKSVGIVEMLLLILFLRCRNS